MHPNSPITDFRKKQFCLVFFTITSHFFVYGQTYTTLTGGDWDNTTDVWSTDGITPCLCEPGDELDGFNVDILHTTNLNTDIEIKAGGVMTVSAGAEVANVEYKIEVKDGSLISNGLIKSKELEVKESGTVQLLGGTEIDAKFVIEGTASFDSLVTILNANLEIKTSGVVTIEPYTIIDILNGNLYNDGTIDFNAAGIEVPNGNIDNKSGSNITGIGFVEVLDGNICNDGTWGTEVAWCASGAGTGLPFFEDCMADPYGMVLPIELLSFDAIYEDATVALSWLTSSELNNDYFTIERSIDGENYEVVVSIDGAGNSNQVLNYESEDVRPYNGISYYRLKQTDYDGKFKFSAISMVFVEGTVNEVGIFPNPSDGGILNFKGDVIGEQEISIMMYNTSGEAVYRAIFSINTHGDIDAVDLQNEIPTGEYFIVGMGSSENEIFRDILIIE